MQGLDVCLQVEGLPYTDQERRDSALVALCMHACMYAPAYDVPMASHMCVRNVHAGRGPALHRARAAGQGAGAAAGVQA